ncbi:MAG: beta-ketoacyl-ACP synthase 3 [Planctomycetaceae bacterium]|nr:beta-ketoacyl-ACP synthase 3 [Planctomycetales bacterium]MCB9922122.1 beta-ketoacyl-ACP synthase 3 [Planctomycetaceae bacterium]
MNQQALLTLYRAMYTARQIDKVEQELTQRGEAFFHVAGSGHEATAALASHLTEADWLHCHYRDKALLVARGLPLRSFFDTFLCKDHSSSRGRRMSGFFSDPSLHILSMTTPTGNNALQAVGVAAAVKGDPARPIVYCANGDGTTQQGEVTEAIAEAVRDQLPVLFVVENNQLAISTTTRGRTFFSLPDGDAESYYGLPIRRIDGRDAASCLDQFGSIVDSIRQDRKPQLVVLEVERLTSHTNADDQRVYRSAEEIRNVVTTGDPLTRLENRLLADGCETATLAALRRNVESEITAAVEEALAGSDPTPQMSAKAAISVELSHPSYEVRGNEENATLTMGQALRDVLDHHLATDSQVFLFGEDIEDPKGDVFGVTRGLSTKYQGRVCNSPLSESTIIGTSIGRALAGQRPVAFLQFADFLPLAYNQLTSELASMFWRTGGEWKVPMVVMAACGGYRPGLGPYHAQTFESVMTHSAGIDVLMPSNACDAAGMLNAAFKSERPTLILYPKSMLNDASRATSPNVADQLVPIGCARKLRTGRDITFVAWGNTVSLCERAADDLERAGVEVEIIDLRSLSPWDEHMVVASAEKTSRLVVVHEDNHTCGFGGEILATVGEKSRFPVSMRRITRPDTFIPCHYGSQIEVMPSYQRVLTTAAQLLDFDLTWEQPAEQEEGMFDLPAIGSAPSDETVTVVEFLTQVGSRVEKGDVVASVEAAKSVFEMTTSVAGEVVALLADEGDSIAVGKPLLRIRADQAVVHKNAVLLEDPGEPVLVRRRPSERLPLPKRYDRRAFDVGLSSVEAVTGNRIVTNRELLTATNDMTVDDIMRLTGIESRNWVTGEQNAVSMAVQAAERTLEHEDLLVDQIDLVICSTTSPTSVSPSMACQVLSGLTRGKSKAMLQAFDISAACSGYLYALQAGYDFLQSKPDARVLVVTTEVLSPLLDRKDLDTAILFGDAASATVLYGESHYENARGRLYRPELSAKGEDGGTLTVPFRDGGFIRMQGRKVFSEAVRSMIASLNRVCQREGVGVNDLNMIVPHQANQRILDAIQHRIDATVYSNIRRFGNTSSTSIPLCLSEVLPNAKKGDRLGLCAFGGGFTFGASILEAT